MKKHILIILSGVAFTLAGFWINSMQKEEKQNQESIAVYKAIEPELKVYREEIKQGLQERKACLAGSSGKVGFGSGTIPRSVACNLMTYRLRLINFNMQLVEVSYELRKYRGTKSVGSIK